MLSLFVSWQLSLINGMLPLELRQYHSCVAVVAQFKFTLPDCVATYLNECKVKSASDAAVLADEPVLTLKENDNC